MARASLRLSKSRFLAGLPSHKPLWWRVHGREAPVLVPAAAPPNILNHANQVRRRAREYVCGGRLVSHELAAQHRMLEGSLADVPIGDHCSRAHVCRFVQRCWPKLPHHHVSSLYRIERKQVLDYEADGYATLYDRPSHLELSAI